LGPRADQDFIRIAGHRAGHRDVTCNWANIGQPEVTGRKVISRTWRCVSILGLRANGGFISQTAGRDVGTFIGLDDIGGKTWLPTWTSTDTR
jgi:hypothetical protein